MNKTSIVLTMVASTLLAVVATSYIVSTAATPGWPPADTDMDKVKNSLWQKNVHGPGWILPINKSTKFEVTKVDAVLDLDKRHGSLYLDIDLHYGESKIRGLVAVRYEKIQDKWYPLFVEVIDTTLTAPPGLSEEDKKEDKK